MAAPYTSRMLHPAVVLVVAALSALASPAHAAPRYRDGELLVRFRDGIAPRVAGRTHAMLRAKVGRQFKTARNVHLVTLPADVRVEDALVAYRRDPAVLYAEPNYTVEVAAVPDDPEFPDLWNMARIDAPEAWDLTTGSPRRSSTR